MHEYVLDIQQGKWPISYRQAVGPLYHYAIIPFLPFTGTRYIGYKVLSVLSGVLSLIAVYLFVSSIADEKTAFITASVVATSFWFLAWARLGNLHAILPGVSAVTVYCIRRWAQTLQSHFLLIGAAPACSGLFLYLGTVLLPVVFIILVGVISYKKHIPISYHAFAPVFFIFALAIVMFSYVVVHDTHEFFSPQGFIGNKMATISSTPFSVLFQTTVKNGIKTAGMFHVRGDEGFRINVPHSPMMDVVSGVMLVIGFIALFGPAGKGKRMYIFIPLLLAIPAISPTLLAREIPSGTRTFAVAPFVF